MSITAIKLKKSSVPGKKPVTGDIEYGELAINYADGRLFYKNSSNIINNFIDSDLLTSRLTALAGLDSADVIFIVDSDYILSRINNLADTKLATISTAGKVSNSATTATSANTASAIVARDGSGNFSAGTITAALSGNASTATTLQTARTIAISGDVTGSATSFNGSADITISAGITAGSIVSADFNSATSLIIYNSAGSAVKTIYSPGS